MIPLVTARAALAQSLFWDHEKMELVAGGIAQLLEQEWRQYDITTYRLHRCIGQIATLERWREGPKNGRSATPPPPEPPTASF